jgi:hypothetical protein
MRPAIRFQPWLSVALLLGLYLLLPVSVGAQQNTSLLEAEYWQLVARTRELVATDAALDTVVTEWAALETVALSDGRSMPIDTNYVTALLTAETVDRVQLVKLFEALESAESTWTPPPANAAAADALTDVLSRSEFDYSPQSPTLWERIQQQLLELFFGSRSAGLVVDLLAMIWPFVAILVVAGVAIYLVRGFFNQFAAQSENGVGDPHVPNLTASSARQRADERSRSGDLRDAVRYLYLAALLDLDERDVLDYDRTRTNREYVRSVSGQSLLAQELNAIVDVFDEVWYGFHPITSSEYARYEARVQALRQLNLTEVRGERV